MILAKNINLFLLSMPSSALPTAKGPRVLIGCQHTSLLKGETASVHFKLMKLNCVLQELVFDEVSQKSQ